MHVDMQTRLNLTRTEECVSGLVANRAGDPKDVISVIHELYDQWAPSSPWRAAVANGQRG